MFLNPGSVIKVTEGDNVTVMSGLNPTVSSLIRTLQLGRIQTESGTAKGNGNVHMCLLFLSLYFSIKKIACVYK